MEGRGGAATPRKGHAPARRTVSRADDSAGDPRGMLEPVPGRYGFGMVQVWFPRAAPDSPGPTLAIGALSARRGARDRIPASAVELLPACGARLPAGLRPSSLLACGPVCALASLRAVAALCPADWIEAAKPGDSIDRPVAVRAGMPDRRQIDASRGRGNEPRHPDACEKFPGSHTSHAGFADWDTRGPPVTAKLPSSRHPNRRRSRDSLTARSAARCVPPRLPHRGQPEIRVIAEAVQKNQRMRAERLAVVGHPLCPLLHRRGVPLASAADSFRLVSSVLIHFVSSRSRNSAPDQKERM